MSDIHVETRLTIPLCVDLDGTLARSDTLWELIVKLIKSNPLFVIALIFWAFKGRAFLKAEVSRHVVLDPACIAYNKTVVDFVRGEFEKGRETVLVTGADEKVAKAVFDYLGIFKKSIASSDGVNNVAAVKSQALVARYPERPFDYMGNSRADIPVFEKADQCYVVNPDRAARNWQDRHDVHLISDNTSQIKIMLRAMRVHQWLKNLLVGVPFLLSHMVGDVNAWFAVAIAFFSFSLMSSAVYLTNDMMDLETDRSHPRKRNRPLASGLMSIPHGLMLAAGLVFLSIGLTFLLPLEFLGILCGYAVVTTAYSLWLKKKLLVDVFTLAGLFTIRVIAGSVAVNAAYSHWLLAFSLFFFLSLALVKRYSELWKETNEQEETTAGRGYTAVDYEMIGQAGISSAFAASLVLALYIDLQASKGVYATPWILWPLCPIILFLLLRIWMLARRGFMEDDPLVFLLRDWRSQIICAVGAVLVLLAAVGI